MGKPHAHRRSPAAVPSAHHNVEHVERMADELRNALRALRIELSIGTRRVAAATGLKDSDLDVLDVLARHGAQSPTTLARRMGIHPATMTGVLSRLEKADWVLRRRDVTDRRAVQVEPSGLDRLTEIYSGANERLDAIAADLDPEAARIVLDYVHRVCEAVCEASAELGAGDDAPSTRV